MCVHNNYQYIEDSHRRVYTIPRVNGFVWVDDEGKFYEFGEILYVF